MFHPDAFNIYASALRKQWHYIIRRECYGCEFDRPSQLDHDKCCMMDLGEQLVCFYEMAKQSTDEDYVIVEIMAATGMTEDQAVNCVLAMKDNDTPLKNYLLQ